MVVACIGMALATGSAARAQSSSPTSDILTLADFPSGWRATPVTPADNTAADTAACHHLATQQSRSIATVGTPKFSDPRAPSELDLVAASVTTMPSESAAKEQVEALLERRLLRCLVQSTDRDFEAGKPSVQATTTVHEIHLPHTGHHVHAIKARTRVSGDEHLVYRQQIVFVQVGTHIVTLHVNTEGATRYNTLRDRLVELIRQRLVHGRAVDV